MLTNCQQNAVQVFSDFLVDPSKKEMVIEGHSGTGKTYLTQELVKTAHSLQSILSLLTGDDGKLNIFYTATTNKAAGVLKKVLKEDTTTIHSLLGLKVQHNYSNGTSRLKKTTNYQVHHNTIIFIDEASMIDSSLLKMIQDSTMNCKVVYIGDPYQLAPVFETTCPVFDLNVTKAKLSTIKRQGSLSPIALLGEQFRQSVITDVFQPIITNGNDILHMDGPTFRSAVNNEFTQAGANLKILAWTNNKVKAYNNYVRGLHTSAPHFEAGELLVTNKPILDKGSSYKNTEDIVRITAVGNKTEEYGVEGYWYTIDYCKKIFQAINSDHVTQVLKQYKKNQDWHTFYQLTEFFADLRPLYSSTVHKAQGSTHDKVFIDLNDISSCHKSNEVARMLYVAATRPSDEVIFYGELAPKYLR